MSFKIRQSKPKEEEKLLRQKKKKKMLFNLMFNQKYSMVSWCQASLYGDVNWGFGKSLDQAKGWSSQHGEGLSPTGLPRLVGAHLALLPPSLLTMTGIAMASPGSGTSCSLNMLPWKRLKRNRSIILFTLLLQMKITNMKKPRSMLQESMKTKKMLRTLDGLV